MKTVINQDAIFKGSVEVDGTFEAKELSPALFDLIHPVGSVYMSTEEEPEIIKIGTWERIEDVFLLAAGKTFLPGSFGGSISHSHVLGTLDEDRFDATCRALIQINYPDDGGVSINVNEVEYVEGWKPIQQLVVPNGTIRDYSDSGSRASGARIVGDSKSTEVLPPYAAIYMWKRID